MMQPSGIGGSPTPNWGAFTFPAGTVIPPLGFIIIGGNHSQVPLLDFNITAYRQTSFGVQYLDGDPTRWFLRDEYGWVALYNPNGAPVDAVFWDAYGDPMNLYNQTEYLNSVVTSTACGGMQNLPAARNIAGIEYAGMVDAGSYVSFQRIVDGSNVWHPGPMPPTPRNCNGICAQPPGISASVQDESCAGGDGSISISITDGLTGPYTINWMNPPGLHQSTLTQLSSGVYIVQVVDAYNCFVVYDTISLNQLPPPSVNFAGIANETCGMGNGSATAVVSNGNPPYTYVWSNGNSSVTASGLPAGWYSVTITDHLGCTATGNLTLINFPGPVATTDSIHHEMCSASDGWLFTNIAGGTPPFTYQWNSYPPQSGQHLSAVPQGIYTLTVTDAHGCTALLLDTIRNTPPPSVQFSDLRADTCRKKTGAVHAGISGGNPPYHYYWEQDTANHQTYLAELSAGVYTLVVTDSYCTIHASVTIPLIPGPTADFRFYPPVATIDNPSFRFEDWSSGTISHWNWNFGDLTFSVIHEPDHTYDSVAFYNVTLRIGNQFGCVDSVTRTLAVIDKINLFVPNCFTPNGDGINDFFFVVAQNITDFSLYLYNRWGELIYSSVSADDRWDGRYKGQVIPEGVYNWVIFYSEDWAGIRVIPKSMKGSLTVVR